MPTHLEHGGEVELSAGWAITLPSSYYQQNEDGSWSAWGDDWAVDIHIMEITGDSKGEPVQPETLLGPKRKITVRGAGWVGSTGVIKEMDDGREVFRFAGSIAAVNTTMSCWVSYFTEQQLPFAQSLIEGIIYREARDD